MPNRGDVVRRSTRVREQAAPPAPVPAPPAAGRGRGGAEATSRGRGRGRGKGRARSHPLSVPMPSDDEDVDLGDSTGYPDRADQELLQLQQQQERKRKKRSRQQDSSSDEKDSSNSSSSDEEDEYAEARRKARQLLLSSMSRLDKEGLQNMHHDLLQLATFALAARPPKSAQQQYKAWKQLKEELKLQGELLAVAADKGWSAARAARGSSSSRDGYSKKVTKNLEKWEQQQAKAAAPKRPFNPPNARHVQCYNCWHYGDTMSQCPKLTGTALPGPPR